VVGLAEISWAMWIEEITPALIKKIGVTSYQGRLHSLIFHRFLVGIAALKITARNFHPLR